MYNTLLNDFEEDGNSSAEAGFQKVTTEEEATEWRNEVVSMLPYGIIGISPLRCEPLEEGKTYTDEDATPKMWSDPRQTLSA